MEKKIKDLTKKEKEQIHLKYSGKLCMNGKCPLSFGYYCGLSLYENKQTRHLVENEVVKYEIF